MNTRILREFAVLAECLSYAVASRKLNLSSSTLSRHISEFEHDLGVVLFARKGGLALTFAGRILLEEASALFTIEDRLKERLRASRHAVQGSFRIEDYVFSQKIKNLALSAANTFRQEYPGVRFEFVPTRIGLEIVDALTSHYFDLAVLVHCGGSEPDFSVPDGLCAFPLWELQSPIGFYVSKSDFPQLGETYATLALADLAELSFVLPLRPEYANFKGDLTAMCAAAGFSPKLLLVQMNAFEDLAILNMSGCVQIILEADIASPDSFFLQSQTCRCVKCSDDLYATPYFIFREPEAEVEQAFFDHLAARVLKA